MCRVTCMKNLMRDGSVVFCQRLCLPGWCSLQPPTKIEDVPRCIIQHTSRLHHLRTRSTELQYISTCNLNRATKHSTLWAEMKPILPPVFLPTCTSSGRGGARTLYTLYSTPVWCGRWFCLQAAQVMNKRTRRGHGCYCIDLPRVKWRINRRYRCSNRGVGRFGRIYVRLRGHDVVPRGSTVDTSSRGRQKWNDATQTRGEVNSERMKRETQGRGFEGGCIAAGGRGARGGGSGGRSGQAREGGPHPRTRQVRIFFPCVY